MWLDQDSCLIFPTGWATRNGYGLLANKAYRAHCERIAKTLEKGGTPAWADKDSMREQFAHFKEIEKVSWNVLGEHSDKAARDRVDPRRTEPNEVRLTEPDPSSSQ